MSDNKVRATRSKALKIYEWCKKKYGRSKYNGRYPTLHYKKGGEFLEDCWGIYDPEDNYILINKNYVTTIEDLASTIIHEYTHYKQNIKVDYAILMKYFDASTTDHPLEKEAESVAERDTKQCLEELFEIYKIK